MKSKTKVNKQLRKKRNPYLVDTLIHAKKNEKWFIISNILSSPRRNRLEKNLDEINKESKEGEIIVVPGKVLSMGELDKKIKIIAFNFSKSAEEKILKAGGKISTILDEIKKNPDAKGVKILQ
jgi:large subunit ribosomal protein L18e